MTTREIVEFTLLVAVAITLGVLVSAGLDRTIGSDTASFLAGAFIPLLGGAVWLFRRRDPAGTAAWAVPLAALSAVALDVLPAPFGELTRYAAVILTAVLLLSDSAARRWLELLGRPA